MDFELNQIYINLMTKCERCLSFGTKLGRNIAKLFTIAKNNLAAIFSNGSCEIFISIRFVRQITTYSLIWTVISASLSVAHMTEMTDKDLDMTTASGFSSYTVTDQLAGPDYTRIDLNIKATTYAEISSMKLGYYDNGSTTEWDEDWTSVKFGTGAAGGDLVLEGFFIEAEFTDVTDSSTFQNITVGWTNTSGDISANFAKFSGTINGGANQQRQNLGNQTYSLANEEFSVTLDLNNGFSFKIGN